MIRTPVLPILLALGCALPRIPDPRPASGTSTDPAAAVMGVVGVTVISMRPTDPPYLRDQTVLVRGADIVAVGATSDVPIPEGATRIDGRGKFLIPGLADMHVHLEYFEDPEVLRLFIANGVTLVRNMDGRPYLLDWKREVASGVLLGPTILTAGPVLDGDPPLRPDNTIVRTQADARAEVARQQAAGYDFVKVYTSLSREAYAAILEAARAASIPVAGHIPRGLGPLDAVAQGQHAIEHLGDFDDFVEADSSPSKGRYQWYKRFLGMPIEMAKADSLGSALRNARIWTTPTLVQAEYELGRDADVEAWLGRPAVGYINRDGRAAWRGAVTRTSARLDDDDWARVALGRRNRLALVSALHRAAAPLLVGTDTPNPFVVPGFSLHEEMALFVEAGVAPAEVLALATRDAAHHAGLATRLGTIEPGKLADLVLLDADPLTDIHHTQAIHGVIRAGRWLPRQELDRMLAALRGAAGR